MKRCYKAAWVVPVERPAIANAAVLVRDGRIEAIRGAREVDSQPCVDFGDVALLPGLVNAHTHLELTDYHGRMSPSPFWDWLPQLVALRGATPPETEQAAVGRGARLSLAAGTTLLGDISRPHQAWPILKESPLRKVCFAELISFAERPARDPDELAALVEATATDDRLFVGVSPHAPYTVYPDHLRDVIGLAGRRRLPITMHLAETPEEVDYCLHGTGAVGEMLDRFKQRKRIPAPGITPLGYLHRLGALDVPLLLAHVNYLDDVGLAALAVSACSVVYCPRAHRYFAHAPHPFARMLDAGINVAVGTDSAASLPTDDGFSPLSVLDEIRFLHGEYAALPTTTLLEMITINAAHALGLADRAGSIAPGKWADFVAVPLERNGTGDPVRNVLESRLPPAAVVIDGERIETQ